MSTTFTCCSNGCLSFPLAGNLSLKKDAGQAGMTKKTTKDLKELLINNLTDVVLERL